MNIFVLDKDIKTCAQYHCDDHVKKMIIEYCQMLGTAYRLTYGKLITWQETNKKGNLYTKKHWKLEDPILEEALMKVSHYNHPCNKWVRESESNYQYLRSLGLEIYEEWKYRRNKPHQAGERTLQTPEKLGIKDIGLTPFPNCTEGEAKEISDIVEAYRHFYHTHKAHFASWELGRPKPDWYVL